MRHQDDRQDIGGRRADLERNDEAEAASLAKLTLQADFTLHQLHKL